jgi:ribosome-associated translation inhibitor RaiA/cold shock CspA family protein
MTQVPLEISFHNMNHSAWAEEEIRGRVADLEAIYERLTSCRVRVDQCATNANDTIPPVVRIELGIPGRKDLVVAHEPDHLQQKFQRPDLRNAINEAFRIAERQLRDYTDKLKDHNQVARHEADHQTLGQVTELNPERDFGFLLTNEGGQLYFHRNSLLNGDFDALKLRDEVYYIEEVGDTGPIATKVRIKYNAPSA